MIAFLHGRWEFSLSTRKSQDTDKAYILQTEFIVIVLHILSHLYIILTISVISLKHIISYPVNIKRYIHRISAFRTESKQRKQQTQNQ